MIKDLNIQPNETFEVKTIIPKKELQGYQVDYDNRYFKLENFQHEPMDRLTKEEPSVLLRYKFMCVQPVENKTILLTAPLSLQAHKHTHFFRINNPNK